MDAGDRGVDAGRDTVDRLVDAILPPHHANRHDAGCYIVGRSCVCD